MSDYRPTPSECASKSCLVSAIRRFYIAHSCFDRVESQSALMNLDSERARERHSILRVRRRRLEADIPLSRALRIIERSLSKRVPATPVPEGSVSMAEPVTDWKTDYDIFDKSYIKDPFPVWDQLRAKCPVAQTERWGGSFMPTRYEDLFNIARDIQHFSSRNVLVADVMPVPGEEQ